MVTHSLTAASHAELAQAITLADVDIRADLTARPSRRPDFQREGRALASLVAEMATNPRNMLQKLTEVAVDLCGADTVGVSLLDGDVFRWEALAGVYAGNRYGTMPRDASPCGVCIDQNQTQLMYLADRYFPALPRDPRIVEALLIPFHHQGKAVGTVWLVTHNHNRRFDREDERILGVLAQCASGAWQLWQACDAAEDANQAGARANNLLTRILAGLPATTVWILDRQLRVTFAAGRGLTDLGVTPEVAMGRSIVEFFGHATADLVAPIYDRAFDGASVSFDMGHAGHVYQASAAPLDADTQSGTIILVGQDITARASLEDAERHEGGLVATLAHEVRQPLAAITAAVEIMKCGGTASSVQRAQSVIVRQVTHLQRLTNDMVESLRTVKGKVTLHRRRVNLNEVARDAAAALAPLFASQQHQLTLTLPDEPTVVDGDADRLLQVMFNLLTNASKYTPHGGEIGLRVVNAITHVEISVHDNGQGIDRDRLPHIFDLFVQASDIDRGGLGVGLAVVRGLVRCHGGTIEARSEGVGRGSEFVVRLPTSAITTTGDADQKQSLSGLEAS